MIFQRFGRAYHLEIKSAKDMALAVNLDEAHWVATSAPVETFRCDPTFLSLIDVDNDGRINASDLKDAINWLLSNVVNTSGINEGSTLLRLDSINVSGEDGKRIQQSAAKMLTHLKKSETQEISLDQIRKIKSDVEEMPVSAVGVVLPSAAQEDSVGEFINDIISTVGGENHPSGKEGISQKQLDRFLEDAKAYLNWYAKGQVIDGKSEIQPLGADTSKAFSIFVELKNKIDQYFAQCEAVALDSRLIDQLPPRKDVQETTDFGDPAAIEDLLLKSPLALPREDRILDFSEPINPYFIEKLKNFLDNVIKPVLGAETFKITENQWSNVKAKFADHENWLNAMPCEKVGFLGVEKLKKYVFGTFTDSVKYLIKSSAKTALQLDNIKLTEKLVLFQAYLLEFANNFVSFPHLYEPASRAMFERGTLIMDGRKFNMAVRVENIQEHAALAENSDIYILYVQVAGNREDIKYDVAIPVTSGGKGMLMRGKRGIFIDIDGNEWDARVIQMIENPISLGEAATAPFKRIANLIVGKIEQITNAAESKLDSATKQALSGDITLADKEASQRSLQGRGLMAGGILAGGGVALAAIGSALTYMIKEIVSKPSIIIGGIGLAILAVLLPSVILAFIKLRRRDLSAILEGAGWAINARMRLTRTQSVYFTEKPPYPSHVKGIKKTKWWIYMTVIAIILVVLFCIFSYTL